MKNMDVYLCKAMDTYPWGLEATIESIQYALSYNDKNPHTLLLAGRIFAEEMNDYDEAIRYYEEAMAIDVDVVKIYPFLIDAYVAIGSYEKALKLIDFALIRKGVNKPLILSKRITVLEIEGKFKSALNFIEMLKLEVLDSSYDKWMEDTGKRIKDKKELSKKLKKAVSKSVK